VLRQLLASLPLWVGELKAHLHDLLRAFGDISSRHGVQFGLQPSDLGLVGAFLVIELGIIELPFLRGVVVEQCIGFPFPH
jgi:hypothetical protein